VFVLPLASTRWNCIFLNSIPVGVVLFGKKNSVTPLAVIAVPCGRQSLKQDKKLHRYYRKKFGKNYVFFEEQIKYKLPEEEEMVEYINQAAKINKRNFFLKIMDNENLALREFLMKGWMSENFAVNILFRKVFLLAIPLMSKLNGKPAYRKIFIVKLK